MGCKRLIDRGVAAKAAMGMIMGGGAVILLPTLLITGEGYCKAQPIYLWLAI